jgi:hypothetical protein
VKTLPIYSNGNGKEYQGVVSTNNYQPLIEMMRFFTPFGIKQYNYLELKIKPGLIKYIIAKIFRFCKFT